MSIWGDLDIKKEQFWHDNPKAVMIKKEKIVVKKTDENGEFEKSVIIPTDLYPLNDKYEYFTIKNTEEMHNEEVLSIFDSVKYQIGRCYTNAGELHKRLVQAGYDAKIYCGWLFVGESQLPIHHAWVMLDNSVLDLSDDLTACIYINHNNWKNVNTKKESRELLADFIHTATKKKNRERCMPVGTPTPIYLYVGCECDIAQGRKIYNDLMEKYPNHECQRNCNEFGQNMTQLYIKSKL